MTAERQLDWRGFWNAKAETPDDFRATGRGSMDVVGFLHTVGEAARILDLGPDDALLDIGCGTGIMALALAPAVGRVHGIDFSPVMVERARENCQACPSATFATGSITEPGVENGAFNKVLAYSVLQYLPDEGAVSDAFAALARLLPPGGSALYAANPDAARKQTYLARVMNSDQGAGDREKTLALVEETLWIAPERLVALAHDHGLEAEARPISPRIWQHFYMFDLVVRRHG